MMKNLKGLFNPKKTMWSKIFTLETVKFMKKVSEDTEDDESIGQFIQFVEKHIDYKTVVIMATQWDKYEDIKQANLAIKFASMPHASRFIMLMDYLNMKFKKGELK